MNQQRTILAIDPGTITMGYAILQDIARNNHLSKITKNTFVKDVQNILKPKKNINLVYHNILKIDRSIAFNEKLEKIYRTIDNIIKQYSVDELAIESIFYGENVQSMLKLGKALGVVFGAAIGHGIPVFEYSPTKVKSAVTGNGRASKQQVARTLVQYFDLSINFKTLDESDAIAIALCHSRQNLIKTSNSSWKDFVCDNANRIK